MNTNYDGSTPVQRPARVARGAVQVLVLMLCLTLPAIAVTAAAPEASDPPGIVFQPDSGGQNDIDPSSLNNQSDLSAYGVYGTGSAGTTTQYGWKWDNAYLSGNNSQDVCVYLSSTDSGASDPNAAEYAVCYSVTTDAAGIPVTEYTQAWYCPTYNTKDASKGGQKCFGNSTTTLPQGVTIGATYVLTSNVPQQFSSDPDPDSQVILDITPSLKLTLINVCAKKSASPSSDSSDCGLERAPAWLKLVKVVQTGSALPSAWTLSWDGPGTNDNSVGGDNTAFVPVPDGSYYVSESTVANYEKVSLVCSPIGAKTDSTVDLTPGVQETCTFTNKLQAGSLKITKSFDAKDSGFNSTFRIHHDCDDGTAHDGDVDLAAGAFTTISGIPIGTKCTVTEPTLPSAPDGWTFGTPSISPAQPVTINSATTPVEVTVTNSIIRDVGTLKVAKTLTGGPSSGYNPDYTISWDCDASGHDGSRTVKAGATAVVADAAIPTGTKCTVSESLPTPPAGYSFGTTTFDPSPPTVQIATKDQIVTVTVNNTLRTFKIIVLVCEGNKLYQSQVYFDGVPGTTFNSLPAGTANEANLCALLGAYLTPAAAGEHTAHISIPE